MTSAARALQCTRVDRDTFVGRDQPGVGEAGHLHDTRLRTRPESEKPSWPTHYDTACASVEDLGQAAAEMFQTHPDYAIMTSFPGLADSTGARVLAEIGDDRTRFADARALKAYAGAAPATRASGHSLSITHRRIKNHRLANVGWMWAFAAATNCEPARQHYRHRRKPPPIQQTPRPALPLPATPPELR